MTAFNRRYDPNFARMHQVENPVADQYNQYCPANNVDVF